MDTSTAADSSASDGATADAPADAPGADAGGVKIVNVGAGGNSFSPSTLTIKVGEKVRWVFASAGHNVVSGTACTADNKFCNPADASCATAPLAANGTTYEHTFTTAGSFPYFCKPHCGIGMIGTVVVTP
jgi:plastocyanin